MNNKLWWGSLLKEKGWEGLNNAAINSFNSNVINSFVREIIQNSNDARRKDSTTGIKLPLKVSIAYRTVLKEDLIYLDQFVNIFEKMSQSNSNKQHKQFFNNGFEAIRGNDKIKMFVYEDYNTTGLSGSDNDPECSFNSCILSEGTSVKGDNNAGGSYGIGKNSIYGFSKVRTVFYSSLNGEGEYIFQGLGKLASYTIGEATYDSRVYFGKGDKLNSIRDINEMPESLRKIFNRSQIGLSQFALCPIENENWIEEFIKAILRNYWPLLHTNELIVELKIEDNIVDVVSSQNLNQLMLKYFSPTNYEQGNTSQEGNPYDFYSSFLDNNPKTQEVRILGETKFYFKELDHKNTNKIAYIRNGMVIQTKAAWGFSSIGYCGVFMCETVEGNSFLRMMEPHTHDRFDPARIIDKTDKYSAKDGEKVLKDIDVIIRVCLSDILNKYRKKAEDIPWLNNLIKSLKGFKEKGSGKRAGSVSEDETLERITSDRKFELKFNSIESNQVITSSNGEIIEKGKVPGIVVPDEEHFRIPLKPGPRLKKTTKQKFTARIFRAKADNNDSAEYKIILKSDKDIIDTSLKLFQIGDSGNSACFEVLEIKDQDGTFMKFKENYNKQGELTYYQISGINMPTILNLKIREPYKSSFKVQEF
ncbi:hypothetical protein [Flavihumibacter fluvii]|uniref:hypothetical protein n=1 Tax=Flavihumibacter fluvii TaxID=2838157 RepID=UPI001BDDEE8B|nr:hypothetical protein [Flavihumibacter fluvii]ULQ50973.1 hypothetical protein KJS93_12850 [Flavihumibacter fluvii]